MNRNIKMVVTDLDGTLLRKNKTISEYTDKTIKRLIDNNIMFVIATARPTRGVVDWLPMLKYDCAIFHNGAVIIDSKGEIKKFGIANSLDIVSRILNDGKGFNIAVEADDILYCNFDARTLWPGVDYCKTEDFYELTNIIADKILIESHSIEEMNELQKYITDDLYLQLSENTVAMVMNNKAKKIEGIRHIAKLYNISMEQIVAFGDDYNDIDMIAECGIGVVVDNSFDEVKKVAQYICESNENDGVARWINEYIF